MTAARRIAALRARALHPATPAPEAQVCHAKLAAIAAAGPVWVAVDGVPGMHIDLAGITIEVVAR
ncbi:hypothetical protein [Mycobacteroides chelonae]|uniref:hypothetical protein n=1 Tax=Mycobacteroides chelonae TaxID=1774 RepID=UPI0018B05086|nr:hypothetical protein [Mycobacteroides chelonae]MBF9519518.1 hypothetical protein [Mycobacteroides chelonae]